MINVLKENLWSQFGATIDMLQNAIEKCPDELWSSNRRFFYMSYHTVVFLDYYLTIPPKNFTSPLPFTLIDQNKIPADAIDDLQPDRFYTKIEILDYLNFSRGKCRKLISSLTEAGLNERFVEDLDQGRMDYPILEILLYNMRHVQHHAAQLNLMLRQNNIDAPHWVGRTKVAI